MLTISTMSRWMTIWKTKTISMMRWTSTTRTTSTTTISTTTTKTTRTMMMTTTSTTTISTRTRTTISRTSSKISTRRSSTRTKKTSGQGVLVDMKSDWLRVVVVGESEVIGNGSWVSSDCRRARAPTILSHPAPTTHNAPLTTL